MATFAQHHSDTSAAFPAADDISNLLIPHYTLANNIQAKNIIAAAAALTGEWALLSLGLVLPESGFVFGNSVNHVLINGPRAVWPYIEKSAVQAGVANTNLPDIAAAAIRTEAAIDSWPFPQLTIPQEYHPDEWSPHACPRFRNSITAITTRHKLRPRQTALACAIATGKLIIRTADKMDPTISTRLALETMLATARLVPLAQTFDSTSIVTRLADNDNAAAS